MDVGDATRASTDRMLFESFDTELDAFHWLAGARVKDVDDRVAWLRTREVVVSAPPPPTPAQTPKTATVSSSESDGGQQEQLSITDAPHTIVIDTETDGGRGGQLAVQLAFVVFDKAGNRLIANETLLRLPPGRKVNFHAWKVHKISDSKLRSRGVDPKVPLRKLLYWMKRVGHSAGGRVVAHNAAFDKAVLVATLEQNEIPCDAVYNANWFCTMKASKPYAGCVDVRGRPRAPKNAELYRLLFGEAPQWARLHESALDDCLVTWKSYCGGVEKGWWKVSVSRRTF